MSYRKTAVLLFLFLLAAFVAPVAAAGNFERTYIISSSTIVHKYDITNLQPTLLSKIHNQEVYVSIPRSLINYYGNLTHTVNDDADYAQFVTPQAVAPIADALLKITDKLPHSQEQFANAVLAFVHQIPYNVTSPKYPVETLADNMGDCVGLSILAASIMEAGGLNVVLIHYIDVNPQHMNVGVNLPSPPVYYNLLLGPTSFSYDNKTYWTAEATPGSDWKVGDQSPELANAAEVIIPLNNTEQSFSPVQVSASLNSNLLSSSITISPSQNATTTETNGERALILSGSITPAIPDQTVTIYVNGDNADDLPANWLFTTVTDDEGNYNLTWNFTQSGTYYIAASWNGASNYAGSDSQTIPVFVGPQSYMQFDAGNYNYIFGQPALAAYATEPMQGTNDFLSLPLTSNVTLSYNFVVLPAGQTISNVQTINVTMPATTERVLLSNGQTKILQVPAHNQTVPLNVPIGLAPLMLPNDFNQTIDNQFCLVLQNNSGNYSLSFNGLSQDDLSSMQAYAALTNATSIIEDNTWYKVTTNIDSDASTTNLSTGNGTLIATVGSQNGSNQTVLLLTNNEDTAIVLKNLTIQTQNSAAQTPQITQTPTHDKSDKSLSSYVAVSVLAAAIVTATLYVRKQRGSKKQTVNNSAKTANQSITLT